MPTLAITSCDGQQQQLALPSFGWQPVNSSLPPDTASIRANGRRYMVQCKNWSYESEQDKPAKLDVRLTFRVVKP